MKLLWQSVGHKFSEARSACYLLDWSGEIVAEGHWSSSDMSSYRCQNDAFQESLETLEEIPRLFVINIIIIIYTFLLLLILVLLL